MVMISDLQVELIYPFILAKKGVTSESSCWRMSHMSILQPARDAVSNHCSNFQAALITFSSFRVIFTVVLNMVANVFDLFFFSRSKKMVHPY